MTMLCANINHHVINSVSVDLDPAIRNIQIDIIFPRRSAGMMEDFFFSSLISQQVVFASVLHCLHMIMMISLFMSYCHERVISHMSIWMKVRNAHCSYSQFFIVFSLLVVGKLQKVAFYGGPMVLLLQAYALQIRRLQPSHAAMLPPRGPRLPDHMAATLPTDQITQILCAETPLLATSFSRRPSRIEVLKS